MKISHITGTELSNVATMDVRICSCFNQHALILKQNKGLALWHRCWRIQVAYYIYIIFLSALLKKC